MLMRVPNAFRPYPLVCRFVVDHVRMQFEDVGAMLRLPMQAYGLMNECNFASASVICNLLSGVSVTIFQPAVTERPDRHGKMQPIGSGEAFKELVKALYPEPVPQRRAEIADVLYRYLRNPFAHALGVITKGGLQFKVSKVTPPNAATNGDGLSQAQVAAIEESPECPGGVILGVQGAGTQWEIIVDFLYRDALDMTVALAGDAQQMQQVEARFQQGTYVWQL